jgi:hypothetical protein
VDVKHAKINGIKRKRGTLLMIDIKPTTLSGSNHNRKITVEIPWDADLYEFVEACKTLAVGLGYNPETWNDVIVNLADELNRNN